MRPESICISQLQFSFIPGEPIVSIPEMKISAGSVTVVLGGNGTGKTTLLKLIGKILSPDRGEIIFSEKSGSGSMIYIHQNPHLLKGTVEQNFKLLLPEIIGKNKKNSTHPEQSGSSVQPAGALGSMLCQMGLGGFEKRDVIKLSGGERKRVAIACAVLSDRDIILMDEPTAHLDEQSIL
ncbi:MAG: ATP-binding cassette domain-containing protein, partial [Spirochaetales bacterium]|nr:ATP-binding cassette domain-containing protein [Spirochaetales bacterium]